MSDMLQALTWASALGFTAYVTNVWGNLLLTRKNHLGFYIRIVPNILWGAYAWKTLDLFLLVNSVTFLAINTHGVLKWRRER